MLDFEVQRFTRHCHATGRELAPGETFYSVLVPEHGQVQRRDYSAAAWPGPPEKALGWWKSHVSEPQARKAQLAPSEVMLEYFEQLGDDLALADERYVLALLMIRRRVVRQERVERNDGDGSETLVLFCPRNEQEYRTIVALPSAERAREIQEKLGRLLYAEGK
jgi:hypothetical protein